MPRVPSRCSIKRRWAGGPAAAIIEDMLENDRDIRVVDKSVQLIKSRGLSQKVAEAFGIDFEVFDTDGYRGPAVNGFGHETDGPATCRAGSLQATVGDVWLWAPEGDVSRILAQTELPALLDNPSVTSIDGVPRFN